MTDLKFQNPEFLWLLVLIPLMAYFFYNTSNKRKSFMKFSSITDFKPSLKSKLHPFLDIMRLLSIFFIILSIARPQEVSNSIRSKTSSGIDIVIAVDISSSMLARDLKPNRLDALKNVASEFVKGRLNDRIGIVIYAGESYTKTPVTSDEKLILSSLQDIVFDGVIQDGTAIGMGLATSVNRLKDSKAKSKVIILFTDGVNNTGVIDPETASDLALNYGIKTYTIGLGTNGNALAPVALNRDGSFRFGMTKVEIDEELLRGIAEKTGGLYFRATDNKSLESIYKEIDKLEKTEIEEIRYSEKDEKYRFLIILALSLFTIEYLTRKLIYKSAF